MKQIFKKILTYSAVLLLLVALLLPALTACDREDGDELTVVCTVFPLYDWVSNVVGAVDGIRVILSVENGTDLHSFQPTAANIMDIADCDLLVCLGSSSEQWVDQAVASNPARHRTVLKMSEAPEVTLRQISLASECNEEGHDHGHGHSHGETDEHLWLSLANARAGVFAIADALSALDGEHAEQYRKNAAAYGDSLSTLDGQYREAIEKAPCKTLLFADRFPFVYLAEDYGFSYIAAFRGCTTETDADSDTIIRLATAADEHGLSHIMVTESSDRALAESVIRATANKNQQILAMDSMQSVTAKDRTAGVTYRSVMEANLVVLTQALSH